MKRALPAVCLAMFSICANANDENAAAKDRIPKWLFLGDDEALLGTITEFDEAILACVYRVEFADLQPSKAMVYLHVTVARSFKGELKPNDQIVIDFTIEVPEEPAERAKKYEKLRGGDIGNLRFCFIRRPSEGSAHYSSEWLYVPKFTKEMNDFMESYRARSKSK